MIGGRNFSKVLLVVCWSTWLAFDLTAQPQIGLYNDERSGELSGIQKMLEEEGFCTYVLTKKDFGERIKLNNLAVIYLPGGWNAVDFAGFHARRNLVDFVAGGGGLLASTFRAGYVRTRSRPLFPEIAAADNRINGGWAFPYGEGPLVQGFDRPFHPECGWDHLVLKMGKAGKIFMVDVDGNPIGAYGTPYGGRYIACGVWLGGGTNQPQGTERTVFLNCIRWLAETPKFTALELARLRCEAELAFLRQDKMYDFLLEERGPDCGPGILPKARYAREIPLYSRRVRLEMAAANLSTEEAKPLRDLQVRLDLALDQLARQYSALASEWSDRIRAMPRSELVRENPFLDPTGIVVRAEELQLMPTERDALHQILEEIDRSTRAGHPLPSEMTKKVAELLYGRQLRETLFPEAEMRSLIDTADKLLAAKAAMITTTRAARALAERERDLVQVPRLIIACHDTDVVKRREAVVELGRIGDRRGIAPLLNALKSGDEELQIRAIQSLAWLQAPEAVEPLIELLKGNNLRLRRRAAQALGQIGDARAITPLLKCVADQDFHVAINAIFSLGWLRATEAIPVLMEILKKGQLTEADTRHKMLASIRALGTIGDKRALPVLEYLLNLTNDFPCTRGSSNRIVNLCSTAQSLGIRGHAELAIQAIQEGHQHRPGIVQLPALSAKERFYALQRNINLLIGRPGSVLATTFAEEPDAIFDYFHAAGVTGIHNAWGEQDSDFKGYLSLVKRAGEYGMIWLDVLPMDGNFFGFRQFYLGNRRMRNVPEKAGCDYVLATMRELPAFGGFWSEENFPPVQITGVAFEEILRQKFGNGFRTILGLATDDKILGVQGGGVARGDMESVKIKGQFQSRPRLYAEYLCAATEILMDEWREGQEWLQTLRKGCALTFNQSVGARFYYIGSYAKAGTILSAFGPETYNSFGRENAFMMELAKDGEARPVMCEFYNWYSPSLAHAVRGFAQHLMHGECAYVFALNQVFRQANEYTMWSWDVDRWDHLRRVFQYAAKIKPYLVGTAPAANVALVMSERTHLLLYADYFGEILPLPRRYYQHQRALWVALQQLHTAADVIWAETLTPEKANRYAVLILADAKSLAPREIETLRDWVRKGGILISTGTTTLFNEWGELQNDYGLADVFGVNYLGQAGMMEKTDSDTYCWDQQQMCAVAIAPRLAPEYFRSYVHREIKPSKSIKGMQILPHGELLVGLPTSGFVCEYDLSLGRDRVKNNDAVVLAQWEQNDPALTFHRFGKGGCYFFTATYPALAHVASGWEMEPNFFDFWPGVRELLDAVVKGAFRQAGTMLPVEALHCPAEVEITVRRIPESSSLVVHLLNYDTNVRRVRGVNLVVVPPQTGPVRVFYPWDNKEIPYLCLPDSRLQLTVRDFEVHEMFVVAPLEKLKNEK